MTYRRVNVADFGGVAVSTPDAKAHLRVDHSDDDALIASYVEAATRFVEKRTGTAMRAQTWLLTLDGFPGRRIQLPGGRVAGVDSVEYLDVDGNQVAVPSGDIVGTIDVVPAIVEAANSWPSTDNRDGSVFITYTVDASNEPGLVHAVKMLVAHWYENREAAGASMDSMPFGFHDLCEMHAAGWYG